MLEETARFQAKTADGTRIFTVVEYRKVFFDVFDGRRQKRLGTREYYLDTGEELAATSDDEFAILLIGLKIYRLR